MIRAIVTVLWLSAGGLGIASENAPSLSGTRSMLEQWVQTRQLFSQTLGDWSADKSTLEETIRLFEREQQSLTEQLAGVSTDRTQVDRERDEALAQQQEINAALDRLKELAAVLEKGVVRLTAKHTDGKN